MRYKKSGKFLVDKTFYTINIKESEEPGYGQPRTELGVQTNNVEEQYTANNVTETRTFDASTATTSTIANALGSLIQDLQDINLIKQ